MPFVVLFTERLDTAKKQWVAKQADCTDQTQNVFVKLLEQSKFIRETVLSLPGRKKSGYNSMWLCETLDMMSGR